MKKRKRSWGAWSPQFLQPVRTLWSQEPSAVGTNLRGFPLSGSPPLLKSRQEGCVCNTQGINSTRNWSRDLAQWFSSESDFAPRSSSGIIWRHFSCHDLWMLLISSESRPGRLLNTPRYNRTGSPHQRTDWPRMSMVPSLGSSHSKWQLLVTRSSRFLAIWPFTQKANICDIVFFPIVNISFKLLSDKQQVIMPKAQREKVPKNRTSLGNTRGPSNLLSLEIYHFHTHCSCSNRTLQDVLCWTISQKGALRYLRETGSTVEKYVPKEHNTAERLALLTPHPK